MSRAMIILDNASQIARAIHWIGIAPKGTRVEFKKPQRSLDQNAKMWAMLTDIASQKEHRGRRYPPDDWKVIFLHALGRETRFVPALEGESFVPIGQSSSDLSKEEMSDLIELMHSWGAANNVVFHDQDSARRDSLGELVAA